MKTPAGSEKEFKNAFVEACKETNAEKDHKEALKCMTEASSKSDMEECDNAEKMTKKWAKKAMKVMKKKMKNK